MKPSIICIWYTQSRNDFLDLSYLFRSKIKRIVIQFNIDLKYDLKKSSVDWFFFFLHPESKKTTSSNFDNLKSNSRNISLSVSLSSETSDKDFVIFINKTHATVSWNVCGDFFVVFLELDSDTLSDCRVGLLSFDCYLFNNNTCCVGCFFEWLVPLRSRVLLLIVIISP